MVEACRKGKALYFATMMFSFMVLPARAQEEDPFSIQVESNLVLVQTEVYNEHFNYGPTPAWRRCANANAHALSELSPSEPFVPKDCNYEFVIHGLEPTDFHVFEDGVPQKIESVQFGRRALLTARDNCGRHTEWSFGPWGKWNSVDLHDDWTALANYVYRIAYVPSQPEKGKCHRIRVTVDRPHAVVYFRDQYCYIEHPASDPLNGTEFGKRLEDDLDADRRPQIPLSLHASFVYADKQKARVDIVLRFPSDRLQHEWVEGDLHATIGVLGLVYRKNRTAVARFTDLACCPSGSPYWLRRAIDMFDLSEPNYSRLDPAYLPTRYETQFDLPAGEYTFQVVLSDGKKFGRAEVPLVIDSYDGKHLAISSVLLAKRFRNGNVAAQEAAAANLAPRYVPLVSRGIQVTPAGDTTFKRSDPLIAYFEIYEPSLTQEPRPTITAHLRIVEASSGALKVDFPPMDTAPYEQSGSTTIRIGDELKIGQLPKGDYRLEVQATDSAGHSTPWRTANFSLE